MNSGNALHNSSQSPGPDPASRDGHPRIGGRFSVRSSGFFTPAPLGPICPNDIPQEYLPPVSSGAEPFGSVHNNSDGVGTTESQNGLTCNFNFCAEGSRRIGADDDEGGSAALDGGGDETVRLRGHGGGVS